MSDIFQTLAQELADATTSYDNEVVEHEATAEDRDHAYVRLNEAWEWTSTGTSGAATCSLADQMQADKRAILDAIGEGHTDDEDPVALINEAMGGLYDAAYALRAYLVSIGLPSEPVTFDSPELRALAEALF